MTEGIKSRLRIMFGILTLAGIMMIISIIFGLESLSGYVDGFLNSPHCLRSAVFICLELIAGTEIIYRTETRRRQNIKS